MVYQILYKFQKMLHTKMATSNDLLLEIDDEECGLQMLH